MNLLYFVVFAGKDETVESVFAFVYFEMLWI